MNDDNENLNGSVDSPTSSKPSILSPQSDTTQSIDSSLHTDPSIIDTAGKVRESEALDGAAVTQWLIAQNIEVSGNLEITQYSGGASNWTYRLQYDNADLILRRPPAGTKAKSAHDMVREYTVQNALATSYPLVPKMIALCTDSSVIGCDFYIMQRLEGIIPRSSFPKGLTVSPDECRQLCLNFMDALIDLHQVAYKEHHDLTNLGKGEGYCRRQVMGWEKRYKKAKTPNVPSFFFVRQWLKRNLPEDSRICVIHNDWRLDNAVLDPQDPTKIIGILDWEMATLGDPLMDLGASLVYWVEAKDNLIMRQSRRQPSHLEGMMTRNEMVAYYLQQTGMQVDNWTFYEVFGLFRLAGIAQQIYYRYYHKQTDNPAFKNFWIIIQALNARALKLIALHEGRRISESDRLPEKLQTIVKRIVR